MNDAYANISEYAVSTWTLEKRDLHSALRQIADAGFSTVELWADTVHFDPRTGVSAEDVKRWLGDMNLSVHSTHAPFRHFANNRPAQKFMEYRQELWRRTIEQTSEVGSPIMVVHGLDRNEYNYKKDEMEIVGNSLADLCEYGRKLGVTIALENIPPGKNSSDELGTNLRDHRVNFAGIGLRYCLDIGHVLLNGIEIIDEIKVAGKDLVSLHIHNNDGIHDSHNIPTEGIIDWNHIYHELRTTFGYDGQFVLELAGGENPEKTLKSLRDLFV